MVRTEASALLAASLLWGLASSCASVPDGPTSDRIESSESDRPPPRVELPTLLGRDVSTRPLPGCRTRWERVETDLESTSSRFCLEFRATRWPEAPVPVTAMLSSSNRVESVSIEQSYDDVSAAKARFESVSGAMLGRCRRRTGGFRSLVVTCDSHVVEIAWNYRHDRAKFEMHYAETYERLQAHEP